MSAEDRDPLPGVSAEGRVTPVPGDLQGGDALMSQRHGGNAVLYQRDAAATLAACTPLPERLLLRHGVQTRKDRRGSAIAQGVVYAIVAVLPVMLVMSLIKSAFSAKKAGLLILGSAAVLGIALRGAWTAYREPGGEWELSHWIDFTDRHWRARKVYTDESRPLQTASLPLGTLALICYTTHWENSVTYDVGLCKAADCVKAEYEYPATLDDLHSADSEDESLRFARSLAALWGVACWQHVGGSQPKLVALVPPRTL